MTPDQFSQCTGAVPKLSDLWTEAFNDAMAEFGIESLLQKAAFLAQVGHESGGLRYSAEIWGPTPAQSRYEGRLDLGNTQEGDGKKFMGHGPIQITGRANHVAAGKALDLDLVNHPELLTKPKDGARSAAWFWQSHGLNAIAASGDFDGVCDVINRGHKTRAIGDANGYRERARLYETAKLTLAPDYEV